MGGLETALVEDLHQRGRGGLVKKITVKGMGNGRVMCHVITTIWEIYGKILIWEHSGAEG